MSNDLFNIQGKKALVTGCRRGIGKAIAIGLAKAGADIIGVSANLEENSDVEKDIKNINREFNGFKCDFGDRSSLYGFINQIKNNNLMPDILINNAGTILRSPADQHPDEYWDKVMEVNLNSQFILSREIGKEMIKQGSGKIIFIASLLTFQGGITVPGYAASKGGIGQLVMALSNEWASEGIQVNAIAPGYIATDNTQALRDDADRSKAILQRIPSGRWGKPEDFIGPAIFLSSAASDYMNGSILTVDGGWMGR
jgi:2-deoxy-D-gluconate 3-dehydrogenase